MDIPMKLLRPLLAAVAAAVFALSLSAAEATPAGTWQWTAHGPHGSVEVTGKFEFKDGALTGTVAGPQGNAAPISAGSFKDGTVAFTVVRVMHDIQFEVKYSGRLAGDTLTGIIDRPVPGGEREQVEWKATRK
jgi:hypothetical protein